MNLLSRVPLEWTGARIQRYTAPMNPIRRTPLPFLLALLAVFMAVPACSTTGTPTPVNPGSPGTIFKNCSSQAAEAAAQQILGAVEQALATGNYIAALGTLATTYGVAEVACAVELAVNELQKRVDATPSAQAVDPVLLTQISNAKSWLASNGAK